MRYATLLLLSAVLLAGCQETVEDLDAEAASQEITLQEASADTASRATEDTAEAASGYTVPQFTEPFEPVELAGVRVGWSFARASDVLKGGAAEVEMSGSAAVRYNKTFYYPGHWVTIFSEYSPPEDADAARVASIHLHSEKYDTSMRKVKGHYNKYKRGFSERFGRDVSPEVQDVGSMKIYEWLWEREGYTAEVRYTATKPEGGGLTMPLAVNASVSHPNF